MKSTNANDGTLTLKVSFEVGSNLDMANVLDAEPRLRGHAPAAAVGQELRRRGQEGAPLPAADHLDQVAERDLRQQLPLELRDDQRQRQHRPHPGRRPDQPLRRQRLRDARLAAAGPDREARAHRARHRERHQPAEPAHPRRPDRRPARRARHRVHLHGEDAGAPAERGGVRRHRRPHQPRRLAGVPQATSPGSSSGRCSTTRSAATTAGLGASSPSSRSPARTRSRWPSKIKATMEELRHALPAGHGVHDLARHDAAGRGGHQRDRPHAVRGGRPRHPRRLHLPAELAGDADPAADRAGLADRRVHVLPAARLLDQRALAARPRARDRHRGRRRDRRGRGGHAPHRARHGRRRTRRSRRWRRCRARWSRSRSSWPRCSCRSASWAGITGRLLPAVRDHDRDLGAALGVQRAHPQPGALGAAAQGADGQEDAPDAVLRLVQQGLRPGHRRLRRASPASWSARRSAASIFIGVLVGADRRAWCGASRPASSPRRTRATCWSTSSCPTPPRSSARTW